MVTRKQIGIGLIIIVINGIFLISGSLTVTPLPGVNKVSTQSWNSIISITVNEYDPDDKIVNFDVFFSLNVETAFAVDLYFRGQKLVPNKTSPNHYQGRFNSLEAPSSWSQNGEQAFPLHLIYIPLTFSGIPEAVIAKLQFVDNRPSRNFRLETPNDAKTYEEIGGVVQVWLIFKGSLIPTLVVSLPLVIIYLLTGVVYAKIIRLSSLKQFREEFSNFVTIVLGLIFALFGLSSDVNNYSVNIYHSVLVILFLWIILLTIFGILRYYQPDGEEDDRWVFISDTFTVIIGLFFFFISESIGYWLTAYFVG